MSERRRILVAEDDAAMRQLLESILVGAGYEVVLAEDGAAAIARLGDGPDLVLTDLRMPMADGLEVLRHARNRCPGAAVVLLTAYGSIEGAVSAMRLGAFDYLPKPLPSPEALRDVVRRALAAEPVKASPELVVVDPAMKRVVETARRVAPENITALILGESGAGKEGIARLLHEGSPRASGPFVAVNCATLAEGVLDSELFGHEKGAFTGAIARKEGKFVQASGGTLFLDEIGETSPSMQARLLRVLQEKVLTRVGGSEPISVDARVVAATNRDLRDAVHRGEFREDLYYRIAAFPIEVPPLRRRPADVLPLAEHFLRLLARAPGRGAPSLTEDAQAALLAHSWPGNVRELQNAVERAFVLAAGQPITAEMLGLRPGEGLRSATGALENVRAEGSAKTLREMERDAIEAALRAEGGNRRKAAHRLGIALRTLQYKLKEYGLS